MFEKGQPAVVVGPEKPPREVAVEVIDEIAFVTVQQQVEQPGSIGEPLFLDTIAALDEMGRNTTDSRDKVIYRQGKAANLEAPRQDELYKIYSENNRR